MRTFTLNSREFHEAVCPPCEQAWIPNGSLPREPRLRDQEVFRAEQVRGTEARSLSGGQASTASEHGKVKPRTRRSSGK